MRKHTATVAIVLLVLFTGCAAPSPAPAQPDRSGSDGAAPAPRAVAKHLVAAMAGEPPAFSQRIATAGSASVDGIIPVEQLVRADLAVLDDRGALRASVAEEMPTTDNGLWRVLSDGRMETTWRIRPGSRWHDGTPLTVDDFIFAIEVVRDRDMGIFRNSPTENALRALEAIDGPDSSTIIAHWKEPFIQADALFSHDIVYPMPKHLLASAFAQDKTNFAQLPYWNVEFIGNGPYRLRDWIRGSHFILEAYDGYALGRPRIDTIEVRFIPDNNALIANLLSGQVELTFQGISLEQAVAVQNQWQGGKAGTRLRGLTAVFPQFLDPSPAVVGDAQLRRALLHAIDRPQLIDVLMGGLVPIAHLPIDPPTQPGFDEIERVVPRYDYDPTRATQLIEGLGYRKGPDGALRDATNQRLAVEIRTSSSRDLASKTMLAVADYWQRIGLEVEPVLVPPQRASDREYLATYPAFDVADNNPNESWRLARWTSAQVPLPDNRFVGSNRIRYRNPEYDSLATRYFRTIPLGDRQQVLTQLMQHMTDQVMVLGLFYGAEASMYANRLRNVTPGSTMAWNAHEWDL